MKIDFNTPILIIGAGSVGERHINNLWSLGYRNLLVFRQRNLPLRNIEYHTIRIFNDWEKVLEEKPVIALICTPTSQHLSQAIECVKNGIHLLIEKPLSHTIEGLNLLKELVQKKNVAIRVGYMLRFHPALEKIKKYTEEKKYGNLLYFSTYWGEYLPDWHPWEDYRQSYAAQRALGGGAALTLSHDLDVALWLTDSELITYKSTFNYKSNLETDVENGADFLLEFSNGVSGHVHVNFFQTPPLRFYSYIFDSATIDFNYFESKLLIRMNNGKILTEEIVFERNSLFVDELKSFIQIINSEVDYGKDSFSEIELSKKIIEMATSYGKSN